MDRRTLLMDCSPGTDDAVAIVTAVTAPGIDLLGVTTVGASRSVAEVTDNAVRLLDFVGCPAPVVAGAGQPSRGGEAYGSAGFGGGAGRRPGLGLPPSPRTPADGEAADFITRTARRHPGEVTLLATGPLTNVAAALAREPGLFDLLRAVVVMGGGDRRSNITAAAEFNFWSDPEAAHAVLSAAGANLTLITLDATLSAPLSLGDAERFETHGGPAGTFAASMLRERIAKPRTTGADGRTAPVHDAVCVAALLDDAVVRTADRCHVTVCVDDGPTRGRSVIDTRPWRRGTGDVQVVWRADRRVVGQVVLEALAGGPVEAAPTAPTGTAEPLSPARGAVPPRRRTPAPSPRTASRASA
jgi:purine nucleosidase